MKATIPGGFLIGGAVLLMVYGFGHGVRAQTGGKEVAGPQVPETSRVINSLDGPTLYKAYCAVCHGPGAKGDGPMARLLTQKTPDLTRIAARHGGKFPRMAIESIIAGDTPVSVAHGTQEMPLWGPIFSEVTWDIDIGRIRVDNVTRYLESLQEK